MRKKQILNGLVPPLVKQSLNRMAGRSLRFVGDFDSWDAAQKSCSGYDGDAILQRVLAAMLQVKSGAAAQERDGFLFDTPQHNWPVLAALFAASARADGDFRVVDIGGALGTSYFQFRRFRPDMPAPDWCVVEQKHFVEAGQKQIAEGGLRFVDDISAAMQGARAHVALLSSSLQYFDAPLEALKKIVAASPEVIIFDRTPISVKQRTSLTVQRVPKHIYHASYPMWVFAQRDLADILSADYQLVQQTVNDEGRFSCKGNMFDFKGLVWERRDD